MVEEVVICLVQVLVDLNDLVRVHIPMGVKVLHLSLPLNNGLGGVILPIFVFLPQRRQDVLSLNAGVQRIEVSRCDVIEFS